MKHRNYSSKGHMKIPNRIRIFFLLTVSLWLVATLSFGQGVGKIIGKVVDGQNGEPLIGTNVIIEGTSMGAAVDIEGNFTIPNVPVGSYTLMGSMIGYSVTKISDVEVTAGDVTRIDFSMKAEVLESDEEVVVTAKALKNTDAALLADRQKAISVSDAISSEQISRSGGGDAADAMSRVTGASVVDGKYVYIRGLGERYSSTMLNGASLPSPDPNRKAVQMDIFPAGLLDNIVTSKTFSPDKPGDFTGGSVDISTKSFPEQLSVKFSTSTSYNGKTRGDTYLTSPGGDTDWLGMDDGFRDVPDPLADPDVVIPDVSEARRDEAKANQLSELSKAFNGNMAPNTDDAPLNSSYSLSYGNQVQMMGRPLGILGSLNYSRNYSAYDDGTTGRWSLNDAEADALNNDYLFTDIKGTDTVQWGTLVNLAYKLTPEHQIIANHMYNRSGESEARYQFGTYPRDLNPDDVYETRTLKYTERKLSAFQFRGEHFLDNMLDAKVEWKSSFTNSSQDEPDLRFFTNSYRAVELPDGSTFVDYKIQPSLYSLPTRYYRSLDEDNQDVKLDITLPFKQWDDLKSSFKFGAAQMRKDRSYTERVFEFDQDEIDYEGDPDSFFAEESMGMLFQDDWGRYRFGNYVIDRTEPSGTYDGEQTVTAGYAMVDMPLSTQLRLITGLRVEDTEMDVASQDTSKAAGNISESDLLPSVNVIYSLLENMNIRLAYGKTLARPTLRELAPYSSFDFVGDFIYTGNPDLERTTIDNYDFRWEWFARPGEIYAVSFFYKNFQNPIEKSIINNNGEIKYQNVSEARVYGAEFELRKNLDQLHSVLNHVHFGGNFSLVKSFVDIPEEEMVFRRAYDPDADNTREFQGQSPYVINLEVGYDNPGTSTTINVLYNVFGERLSEVSLGGVPDIYEQPRHALDVIASQKIWWGLGLKFSAKNILDAEYKKEHEFKGNSFTYQSYQKGPSFSLGLSYQL